MNNVKLREILKASNIKQWQLAKALNTSEFTLSRKLRNELNDNELKEYLQAIKNITNERGDVI